jgi:tetratricopeptide (TPR) repeat protein
MKYIKQIVVIIVVVIIMAFLYKQPVKGLIKPDQADGHSNAAVAEKRPVVTVTVEMVSAAGKIAIGPALAEQINGTEAQLKNAGSSGAKLILQKKLAKQWDDVNQQAPAAFYYQAIAQSENTFDDWLAAGNHFNDAFRFDQDTVAQPSFVSNAIDCFTNASKIQPGNLDAKTGLGVAYVNQFSLGIDQGGGPPKGVMILLDVVGQDPKNVNANLNLGMFAMNSKQYDKAILRFKTVIAQKPAYDSYFYLAECYRQLGMKSEAIDAYQKSRAMMPDTTFDKQVDGYIKELKN